MLCLTKAIQHALSDLQKKHIELLQLVRQEYRVLNDKMSCRVL